ncbi:MAG: DUF11 domain-containing protein [bacterium]|nr:DUF11 domain-containing protein [bacterium]
MPTGLQEYFILGYEQHVWDMMSKVEAGEGGGPFADAMNSLITAVASADNQVIYFDHWEDGLEADIFNPVQASTVVIGDGNPANGDACDFNSDPCGVDVLIQGDFVNFASNQGIAAGCTVPSASPLVFTELCSSVPLNPRCAIAGACTASEVRFDGGDFLETTGGPLSLVHSQDPLTQFIGGSTEVISKQAVQAARSYSVPIGEDLYPAFGCPDCVMEPFHYVDLNLVAFEDNTQVFLDSPGAGTVSFTLDRGEHWSSLGYIDDSPQNPGLQLTINSGTKVSTTAAIAGMMFTGGDGQWATRHYTLLPDILHSTDYVITAPGDDPAVTGSTPNRPLNIYLFNPDPLNPVTVTATDTVGSTAVAIPPNSVVDYFTGTGRFVPNGSTVRMTSNRNFWGISGHDYDTNISDWGHSWLATKFLSSNYTVSFAPGTLDPPVDMVNLSAVFIAATADNTRVQIDFDNDGVFDVIDLDGDGVPDPAPLPGNTYLVSSLASLRVFDPNDFDNTGTRIVANKPVAVSYGQDTDLTDFGDTALDTGFTVYPTDQLFLDNVLVLTKSVDTPVIPTAGGVATYTVTIQTFGFFPIIGLLAYDLLPPGVLGTDYVPGSTLVTYPDLTQDTADPVASIDPVTGRDRLDWTLNPDSMGISQTLTIRYSISIPAAPGGLPRVLTNEAHAQGNLGASVFSPFDTADVVQSDLILTKSVTDDGTPEPGDVLTYTLNVSNNGVAAETNAIISDAIPPDTTFLPGSVMSSGPFAGAYSAGQNAVVWTAANFPVGGPHVLSFQVTINPGVPAGTTIANSATFESLETPLFPSNQVDTVTLGPLLAVSKTGPALLHPNETGTFEILVENVGAGTANNLLILDPFPTNATYVPSSMEWRTNVDPFVSVTDAADADEGTAFVDRLELAVASLGPGEDITFRFEVQVDPGTGGLVVNNQATVSSTEVLPTDTNLVQVPIVGDADITGHVFLDLDGNGVQGAGEPDLANVDVVVTDALGNMQTVTTDGSGNYLATVEPGSATLDVDETDPDFPVGAVLTTANDPQMVVAVSAATVAATPVGYDPPPISFVKSSDTPFGQVVPGDTVTYTLEAENLTGVDQTTVTVSDPLPTGTLAVPGSTVVTVTNPVFRVSEYFIAVAAFGGTVFDLTLDQDLAPDYFAVVQGSAGGGGTGGDRDPEADYARLTQDPFGTGDLAVSSGSNVLRLERRDGANSWVGVVTVVECVSSCATAGFNLLTVEEVLHAGATVSGSDTAATAWTDINQVMLMGGFNGAGCYSDETTDRDHPVCHARLTPSGTDTIDWTRDGSFAALTAATSTVMVVEWGSEWTVQRVQVTGTNGGNGLNATGEYNTAAISSVARGQTWVWGTGHADGNGIGNQAEGVAITLGDGVNQNASESQVAVGTEIAGTAVDFQVWALTHPSLAVDYAFKLDGDGANLTVDVPVVTAGSERMALVTNGQAGTSDNYPRPIFSARYVNDSTVRLERRRSGSNFPAWVQGVDFSAIGGVTVFAGGDPAALVIAADNVTLAPGGTLTVTFQVQVDPNLAPAITQIVNDATLNTDQEGPLNASVTDNVIRLGVTVEPNNGNFVVFDAVNPQTRTYGHVVTNTGQADDSYEITALSELGFANPGGGWIVELIDPDTGTVIATDTDFSDATWDGMQAVNTGTLMAGESIFYDVRVTVPAGTPESTEESTTLTAVSDRNPATFAFATDETTVVDMAGPVILVSDQSGIVAPSGSIAYPHRIINNTGATDTFDLTAFPDLPGWTSTIYNDSNGDGIYTPGIDVAIMNTLLLADGASQLFFVLVEAPGGASDGDTDVTSLTAISRNDTNLFDAVSDTTTVNAASTHDLSGGDTLLVDPGDDCVGANDCPVFPGTLKSLSASDDRFDFTITASPFFGLDGLLHPTQLWIDTDADGVPDMQIAEDTDGDGDWDTIAPGFDTDTDMNPDAFVAAGGELAYELRRPVDPLQLAYRDPVTLTATSQATGEVDSVTAVNLLAAFTPAMLSSLEAYTVGGQVVVRWQTAMELGTAGFVLHRRGPDGELRRLHGGLLGALRDAPVGGTYRFIDAGAAAGQSYTYVLRGVGVDGDHQLLGQHQVTIDFTKLARDEPLPATGFSRDERVPFAARAPEVAENAAGVVSSGAAKAGGETTRLRLLVQETGLYFVDAATIAGAFGVTPAEAEGWITGGWLRLHLGAGTETETVPCPSGSSPGPAIFADGFESGDLCAWSSATGTQPGAAVGWLAAPAGDGIYFYGEGLESIYTDDNVYWLELGAPALVATVAGGSPVPVAGLDFADSLHFEEETLPLTSVIEDPDSDFWYWGFVNVTPGAGVDIDTLSVVVETPGRTAAAIDAMMTVHLQAESRDDDVDPDHQVEIRLNGTSIGTDSWDGSTAHQMDLTFSQTLLADGANTVEIHAPATSGIESEIFFLDSIDISYRRSYTAVDDRLIAQAAGHHVITIDGYSRDDVTVFDITDPEAARLVTNPRIEPSGGGYQVSFETATPSSRYLAMPLEDAAVPTVEIDQPSDLRARTNRADYLVIAAAGVEAAAEDLADYRQGLGFETRMVRLQDVYDEFNQGVVSPWAIRDFLAYATASWQLAPRFAVLAGDSSFDFKDRLGFGGNLLPSPMTSTPAGLFPSDHRIADLAGDDGVPEVAVGRLPVRTGAQLAAYLAKLVAYEAAAGAWKDRTVWVADAIDEGGEFVEDSEWLIDVVPAGLAVDRVYVDDLGPAAARQELLDAFDDGALLIHFLGHGNLTQIGDNAGLMMSSDVPALTGGEKQPILVAMTCALGRFDRIVLDTLSESLVLHEDGGVIALWAPTGLSFNQEAVLLADGFLPAALADGPGAESLGEAVAGALDSYLSTAQEPSRFIPFIYTLLGDPAIRMRP